jgi:hypothetical protein
VCHVASIPEPATSDLSWRGILANFKTTNGRDPLRHSKAEGGNGITILRLSMHVLNIQKISERAFLYFLIRRSVSFRSEARVIFLSTSSKALAKMPHAHSNPEMPDPITIADVREIAQKRLDPAAWDYYITGADDEQTVRRNETIFKK